MKEATAWIALLLGLLLLLTLAMAYLAGVELFMAPYVVRQQTAIVRASNGYVTSQQEMLRQFRTDYAQAASPDQQTADVRQMSEVADKIPGYVQPDIAAFLAEHRGTAQ